MGIVILTLMFIIIRQAFYKKKPQSIFEYMKYAAIKHRHSRNATLMSISKPIPTHIPGDRLSTAEQGRTGAPGRNETPPPAYQEKDVVKGLSTETRSSVVIFDEDAAPTTHTRSESASARMWAVAAKNFPRAGRRSKVFVDENWGGRRSRIFAAAHERQQSRVSKLFIHKRGEVSRGSFFSLHSRGPSRSSIFSSYSRGASRSSFFGRSSLRNEVRLDQEQLEMEILSRCSSARNSRLGVPGEAPEPRDSFMQSSAKPSPLRKDFRFPFMSPSHSRNTSHSSFYQPTETSSLRNELRISLTPYPHECNRSTSTAWPSRSS